MRGSRALVSMIAGEIPMVVGPNFGALKRLAEKESSRRAGLRNSRACAGEVRRCAGPGSRASGIPMLVCCGLNGSRVLKHKK